MQQDEPQPEQAVILDVQMEIEADEDVNEPNPIEVWQELVENGESVGVNADLLAKARACTVPGDAGDESRRERSE